MSFSEKLKSLRMAAGMTQKELADKIGIKQPSIAQLEVSDHQPTWETVQKLAWALGVGCDVFADWVAPSNEDNATSEKPKEKPAIKKPKKPRK